MNSVDPASWHGGSPHGIFKLRTRLNERLLCFLLLLLFATIFFFVLFSSAFLGAIVLLLLCLRFWFCRFFFLAQINIVQIVVIVQIFVEVEHFRFSILSFSFIDSKFQVFFEYFSSRLLRSFFHLETNCCVLVVLGVEFLLPLDKIFPCYRLHCILDYPRYRGFVLFFRSIGFSNEFVFRHLLVLLCFPSLLHEFMLAFACFVMGLYVLLHSFSYVKHHATANALLGFLLHHLL
mmetsp:Transcript_10852/g.15082  ORF Transcript_10852/g.15082 Transcript_10852/m.15082 type:complete len:234 (+) Transcript_10852:130-831(+)